MAERINEQGWHLVDVSKESLHFKTETTSAGGRALLARRDFSSLAEIFSSIFPADFIGDVLSTILEANPDAFYSNTGSHGKLISLLFTVHRFSVTSKLGNIQLTDNGDSKLVAESSEIT